MAEDLSEIQEMSAAIGPKKVETPQVKAEQFDPTVTIRAANLLAARKVRPILSNCDVTIVSPKGKGSCSNHCTEEQ